MRTSRRFSYLGTAAKYAAPRYRTPLPPFTREYVDGLPTFTKRYFENLFRRLKPPCCFVIDNYQDVPPESPFHEVVREGIAMMPDGVTAVIISRADPPFLMSRLRVNGSLEIINNTEIGFTLDESRELVASQGRGNPPDSALKALFQRTAGWAAGLILLSASSALGSDVIAPGEVPVEQIFEYFAAEVFDRTDDEVRLFLLTTAFLPRMTAGLAQKLTGNNRADQLLARLNRSNFFTVRHASVEQISYQYHPLFREFLQQRAGQYFGPDEITGFKKKAALLLETEGQTDDAARLCIEVGDWRGLSALILHHASRLLSQGRYKTVEAWIESIPSDIVERSGWLLYWKASCRITAKPGEARGMLESAYARFLDAQDPAGSFLSWAGIVNTFMYEWRDFRPLDKWIEEFTKLRQSYDGFPSPEAEERATSAMFAALMFRRPQHPDLPQWTERVQTIVLNTPDTSHRMFIGNNLILYYLWTGRITEAGALVSVLSSVIKSAQGAPLPKLMWYRSKALYHFYVSQTDIGLRAVEQGLQLADETGVHLLDLMFFGVAIYHATALGDVDMAEDYLDRMTAVFNQESCYASIYFATQSSLVSLLRNDVDSAIAQAETGARLTDEIGFTLSLAANRSSLAFILAEAHRNDKLEPQIAGLRNMAALVKSRHIEAWCSSLEAQIALRDGNDAAFIDSFSRAIEVCKRTGLRLLTFLPATLSRICNKALELDLEVDFVKELIRLNKLSPDTSSPIADSWPYPLKVHTLGRFELIMDGKPLVFGGKVQQKPLAMLKAIIALGGRDVDGESLVDALWPEAEGDHGRSSFDTTLHRLRKLLSHEKIIQFGDGKVSLDERYCRVDAWAFEKLIEGASPVLDFGTRNENLKNRVLQSAARNPQSAIERALALYHGHFLAGEAEPWALSLRERLRSKYISAANRLGRYCMESGKYEKSVEVYQRGLEVDDLSEEFYQNLMMSYLNLGRKAEAATTYRRCHEILLAKLGLSPSERTKDIYSLVRA